jgi:hypothetical protein
MVVYYCHSEVTQYLKNLVTGGITRLFTEFTLRDKKYSE